MREKRGWKDEIFSQPFFEDRESRRSSERHLISPANCLFIRIHEESERTFRLKLLSLLPWKVGFWHVRRLLVLQGEKMMTWNIFSKRIIGKTQMEMMKDAHKKEVGFPSLQKSRLQTERKLHFLVLWIFIFFLDSLPFDVCMSFPSMSSCLFCLPSSLNNLLNPSVAEKRWE